MERLRLRRDFDRMFRTARRTARRQVVLFVADNAGGEARIGVCIPGKSGTAVERNRARRVLREAFRLRWNEIPPGVDLVLLLRGRARDVSWTTARAAAEWAVSELGARSGGQK